MYPRRGLFYRNMMCHTRVFTSPSTKRQTSHDLPSSQAQRDSTSLSASDSSFEPPRSSPVKSHPPPEPGSLNEIIRTNCRTRLFLPPVAWSSLQLELLGCHFVDKKRLSRTRHNDIQNTSSPEVGSQCQDRMRAATQLCQRNPLNIKLCALEEILATWGFHCLE